MHFFIRFSILFLALTITNPAINAQLRFEGKVVNQATKSPIPFANIGIANTKTGTISNEDGTFSILIPEDHITDSLLFSSVGYKVKSLPISSLAINSNLVIALEEEILELDAFEISANREKPKTAWYGNGRSYLLSGQIHYDSTSAGSAMALLIYKNPERNMDFLHSASLYIARNLSPEFKVRLRIMNVDAASGQPGTDIVKKQYIQVSNIKKGWLDFNFDQTYQVEADSFYLVFEWILDESDRNYITKKYSQYMGEYPDRVSHDTLVIDNEKVCIPRISTVIAGTVFGVTNSGKDLENHVCYYRSNSFGEWKRSSGILSAKIKLSNYPSEDAYTDRNQSNSSNGQD